MLDCIGAFLGSTAHEPLPNRVLATVLWARIQAEDADDEARLAFEAHVRREVGWFRGRALGFRPGEFVAAFDGPARAIACARALAAAAPRLGRVAAFGLHTGECDVTPDERDVAVAGVAVERARSVCGHAAAGEVLVSRTVTDLVAGSGLTFVDRGEHELTDHGERWRLFAATEPHFAIT
jgi:class 3 adenylate cyclase